MRTHRLIPTLVLAALLSIPAALAAQGVTTGAIGGTVTDTAGNGLADVQVQVVNRSTGFTTGTMSRTGGRYLIQGLEVGGPYTLTVRRIGFAPQVQNDLRVGLSTVLKVDVKLVPQAVTISAVTVTVSTADFAPTNTGTKSTVSDTMLQRLPTISRNLTDFIKLTPQVSQSGPGFSGGGMSNRMNNVQIDGATERDVFGLGSTGQPGAEVNAKSVSIDAVKEFQVLLAPFDVRQGNFGGLLLNAITKSGTNNFAGSAFFFYRDQTYGADTVLIRGTPFNRKQYGFSLGGPIIKDKLHFFIAPEFQEENSPLGGPYLGQSASARPLFPFVNPTTGAKPDIDRFESIMQTLGETKLGTAGYQNVPNPLSNMFARFDYRLNDMHRLVFRYNFSQGERVRDQTGRIATRAVYSGNLHDFKNTKNAPVVQLFSNFRNGSSNEVFFGYNRVRQRRVPKSSFPQITVFQVPLQVGTGVGSIVAGADQFSQGNELDTDTWELTENFTIPHNNHTFTFGTRNEYVSLRNQFNQSSYGVWSFRNLDSLALGNANSFRKSILLRDSGNVYFKALQTALYAQDQWQVTPRLALTAGMRFDISKFVNKPTYNAPIDSAYGRRTDDVPGMAIQYSPRLGFNYDVTGDEVNQLRGGLGLFVGTPPYVWLENAYVNSGNIITFLNCNTSGSREPAPSFSRNPSAVSTCRGGAGFNPIGDVNFLGRDLKFPQPLRGTLAFDRRLPYDLVFTVEGLYSKTLNQLFFVNRNLRGPTGVDRRGRVLYDTARGTAGQANPVLPAAVIANGGSARFSTAIDLVNQSKDYSYNITTQLRRRFVTNWEAMIAYTYGRARDVQSFTSSTAISNWQFGRTLSGRQEDAFTTTSLYDQPHKVVGSASYTVKWPWLRREGGMTTDISMFVQGVSGAPFDYVYGGFGGAGDLNGDGRQGNDLIYIPKNALDPTEIVFRDLPNASAATQAQAFENYIRNSPCLSGQRGQILERNSCRQPFVTQADLAIRQSIPTISGQRLSLQLDIFNFANLLNKNWGKARVTESSFSNVQILTHVGQTGADPRTSTPIFTFNTAQREFIYGQFISNFWRSQVSIRYSF